MVCTAAALLVTGCGLLPVDTGTVPRSSNQDGVEQSDALLTRFLGSEAPGCSAAVAVNGELAWSGARGVADKASRTPLTQKSVFDFASVSKQFTATAILLLEHEGVLSQHDPLSKWVPGLPEWAGSVALGDLMHHRSGIPDYTVLLADQGVAVTDPATQEDALRAIGAVSELRAKPGSAFEYSNSNYVLLAQAAENAAATPFADLLSSRVFGDHELSLARTGPDVVRNYEGGKETRSAWSQVGDGSVHGTPATLVLWADYYRTRSIDGVDVGDEATSGAKPTGAPDGSKYGAGILVGSDDTLSHIGVWAGAVTLFGVTADRATVLAVSCNSTDAPAEPIAQGLRTIWGTPPS